MAMKSRRAKGIGVDPYLQSGMERMVNLQIERLPEGVYLATSDTLQGLVVQGNTITETIEIARDVAKKLIEAQEQQIADLTMFNDSFDYPLVVSV